MRDLHGVRVSRGILHLIAPRTSVLDLSEIELPLRAEVAEFLAGHVERGLGDPQAKAANFIVLGHDRASGVCDRLLGSRPRLVDLSQQLARLLYAVSEPDERIKDGTLAVLLCQAVDPEGANQHFLAILKLDPSSGWRTAPGTDQSGRHFVDLEQDPDILPKIQERVQKCAFIRATDPVHDYRILLVDRQREPGVVSRFFRADFLGAEDYLDTTERTKKLYRSLTAARNQVAEDLTASELEAVTRIINAAVVGRAVNLDNVISTLPVRPEIRERVDAVVSRELPDREFDLDQNVSQQFLRRRSFVGDNGLKLSVPSEFYEQMVTVEDVRGSQPPIRHITIETRAWKET